VLNAPPDLKTPSPAPVLAQPASNDVGLLGRIFGYGDQTPDPNTGLTRQDQAQMRFSTLGQLGAMLMAAGQPIAPGQRAQILASMGNIPAQSQQMAADLLKQRSGAIQVQQQRQKADALAAIQKAADDPATVQGLTPAQQQLLKSAFLLGDLKTAEALIDPNKNRARIDANGNITTPNGAVYDSFGKQIVAPGGQVVPRGGGFGQSGGPLNAAANTALFAPSKIKGRDDQVLKQIAQEYGPEVAAQVRGFADYKTPFPVSGRTAAMANPNSPSAKMLNLVTAYAPDWKQSDFSNQAKLWNEFYGSGKTATNITALDTAYGHLGDLYDAGMALENRDTQAINAVTNRIRTQLGDPKVVNAQMAANAVAHEMASVFRQVGMSEGEIKEWQSQLSPNMSPAQIRGAVIMGQKLMQSRVEALQTRYARGGGDVNSINWFTPEHVAKAEEIKRLAGVTTSHGPAPNPTNAPAPTSGGPRVGEIVRGYRFNGGDPSNQSSWEKVQ
jgi:hypothetical protein